MKGAYRPLSRVDQLQKRSIGRHLDDVAVSLQSDHEHRLRHGTLHVRPVTLLARVLANEVGHLAVLVVELVEVTDQTLGSVVCVPVQPDALREILGQAGGVVGTGNESQVGVDFANSLVVGHEALGVRFAASAQVVLVTDLDNRNLPGLFPAVGSTLTTVRGARVAENVLSRQYDFVE